MGVHGKNIRSLNCLNGCYDKAITFNKLTGEISDCNGTVLDTFDNVLTNFIKSIKNEKLAISYNRNGAIEFKVLTKETLKKYPHAFLYFNGTQKVFSFCFRFQAEYEDVYAEMPDLLTASGELALMDEEDFANKYNDSICPATNWGRITEAHISGREADLTIREKKHDVYTYYTMSNGKAAKFKKSFELKTSFAGGKNTFLASPNGGMLTSGYKKAHDWVAIKIG